MNLEKVISPLMVVFNEDINRNNGPTHITDILLLTIKSLLPSEDAVRVDIDYTRYKEEFKLWKYYRHGENPSILNILNKVDAQIYWKTEDDTLFYRLLPIILVNKDFDTVRQEIIKNILFTTGNIEVLIEGLLLSKLIYCLIEGEEDIINRLKEEIINFSQIQFLEEYGQFFRIPLEKYKGKYQIDFEQNKIYGINTLNFLYSYRFKTLEDCLKIFLNGEEAKTTLGKAIEFYIDDKTKIQLKLDSYYYELGNYIYNLRNGRIDPKLLKIEKYQLPDIFKFQEEEIFYHSLLNRSKVIKRQDINGRVIIHLETKSGIYRFVNN